MSLQPILFTTAERTMTDAALVTAFVRSPGDHYRAERVIAELRARPAAKWSGLTHSLEQIRRKVRKNESPSVALDEMRRSHYGYHSAVVISPIPEPYHGDPEFELLSIVGRRGDLHEVRAWAEDPFVPPELHARVTGLLNSEPRGPK